MWQSHDGMGWWMVFGGFLWLLFWASIIWGVVGALRSGREQPSDPSALEIARVRYARGEINRDEFLNLQADLTANGNRSS